MSNFFKLIRIKARNIKRSLRSNLEAIWMCILLCSPFLSLYFERKRYSIIMQLFAIVLVIFLMYLDQYNYNKPSIEGMPIMRKKLAHYEKSTDTKSTTKTSSADSDNTDIIATKNIDVK